VPVEVFDKDEFLKLSEKATECTIKKNKEYTKLKLRTSKYLYTIKLDPSDAEELAGKINCPTIEI
jgi:large subunit ribosomal protein L38e